MYKQVCWGLEQENGRAEFLNNPKHFLPKRFFPKYFINNIYIFWHKYCAYHKKDKNPHWFCLTCAAVYNSYYNNIDLLVLINKDIQKKKN